MRFSPVLLASMAFPASLGGISSAQAFELGQIGHLPSDQSAVVGAVDSTLPSSNKSEMMTTKPSAIRDKHPELGWNNHHIGNIVEGAIAPPEKPLASPGNIISSPESGSFAQTRINLDTDTEFSSTLFPVAFDSAIILQSGELQSGELQSGELQSSTLQDSDTVASVAVALDDNSSSASETQGKQTDASEEIDANGESEETEAELSTDEPTADIEDDDSGSNNSEVVDPEVTDSEVTDPETDGTATPVEPPAGITPFGSPPPVEQRILVVEVNVEGVEDRPELLSEVYRVVQTQPGQTTTESQLQDDINAIFATGFFSGVRAGLEDTPLGVRLSIVVTPNPILRSVTLEESALAGSGETLEFGGEQLTIAEVVDAIFSPQYGRTLNRVPPEYSEDTLNLGDFQAGINELYEVYGENGYVLAQVVDADISEAGDVTLVVAEGIIEDIEVQFLDDDGFAEDEEGNPIDGKTRDFIITRQFESQPGEVFNQNNIQQDLQRVFGLGIFDDVRVSLNPGEDPRKVDVIVNVIEGNTGSLAAGAGFSSASGLFGSASYQQQNLGGNNQSLGAEIQIGQRELLFDLRFTDPWIATDPYRTSYTVNTFLRRSISLIFDGGETEVDLCEQRNDVNCSQDDLEDGDRPRVQRLGGGISFSRPLDEWLGLENWRASTGFQYQRVSIRDGDGDISFIDALGNQLSFTDDGKDDLFLLQLAAVRDLRNNPAQPTSGSLLRFGTEQSLPLGSGSILLNRVRASYSHYVPVDLTDFKSGPEALAFNVQAGTVLGDLPPYEAFSLGGTDSVRGYDAGELGSGRSFLQASAEYRFPIFAIIGGALFLDFGTDLGTASEVPGAPADVRDKPGTGFGYGLGVRVQSPLGQIRVDYGINDDGDGRIHFGIGERF